jgi:hypothetical protein
MSMVKLIAWFMGWDQWAESKCCSSGGWNNSACSLGRLHGCTWCPQTRSLHIQDTWLEPFWVCWQTISTTSCPLMHTCEHAISRSCILHHTSISLYNMCCCICLLIVSVVTPIIACLLWSTFLPDSCDMQPLWTWNPVDSVPRCFCWVCQMLQQNCSFCDWTQSTWLSNQHPLATTSDMWRGSNWWCKGLYQLWASAIRAVAWAENW